MPHRKNHRRLSNVAAIVAICLFTHGLLFTAPTAAQTNKKQKDFGSSLARLRWDASKRAAVGIEGRAGKGGGSLEGDDVLSVETTLVAFDVLVLDAKGQPVRGLAQSDFTLADDGVPQKITTFSLGDDAKRPRSVVLVIDHSGSQRPYLKTSIAAAKTLVDELQPADRMAVVTDDVALVSDFTQDKKRLKKTLDSLLDDAEEGQLPGHSLQYSALMATLLELLPGQQRPVVIFQTDGDEYKMLQPAQGDPPPNLAGRLRQFSLVDVINAAERARATVYSVVPSPRLIGLPPDVQLERAKAMLGSSLARAPRPGGFSQPKTGAAIPTEIFNMELTDTLRAQTALEGLSKLTGGWAEFLEQPSQATQTYARILSDINQRYVLGFQPTDKARDGRRHKVAIAVRDHPEYVIIGRKFYYAPDH